MRTFFDPHNGKGVHAMDLSEDNKYILTVSTGILARIDDGRVAPDGIVVGMDNGQGRSDAFLHR